MVAKGEKMDEDESLSEEEEQVQTSKRPWCPPKVGVKVNKKTSKADQSKKK